MRVDVVVIGAGAAGIFAAWRAATLGASVVLLEKTPRIGTKILVSGGGKCNIAHDGPLEDVLKAFRPNEARFLRPSVYRHPNHQIIDLFTGRGLDVYTRPDGRIFPTTATAKDVVAILRGYLDEVGVDLRLESGVDRIVYEQGRAARVVVAGADRPVVRLKESVLASGYGAKALLREAATISHDGDFAEGEIECGAVVLATGGSSYPNSGTTGDGWAWAKEAGHTVVKVRAALAPLYVAMERGSGIATADLSGVALREIELKARGGGKTLAKWRGDLLFTHQGISGPVALGVSRLVAEHMDLAEIDLYADAFPDTTQEALAQDWIEAQRERTTVGTRLKARIPERIIDALFTRLNLDPALPTRELDKKSRNRLCDALKAIPIGHVRTVPLEKGEVVAGGVALDEVDSKTMASTKTGGLFLCGEILDIAGPVGGYNLQAAFATGYVAGESAAEYARDVRQSS